MNGPARNRIRVELIAARQQIDQGRADLDRLIREGAAAGINKAELGELAGLSRQTIHTILSKEAQQ